MQWWFRTGIVGAFLLCAVGAMLMAPRVGWPLARECAGAILGVLVAWLAWILNIPHRG